MAITPFTDLYNFFDQAVIGVIQSGTANMIALISPLLAACFGIYVMLIMFSYWRGENDEPVIDFFYRMIGWAAIITFGLNINYYTQYVVPFFNGLGDDLSGVVGTKFNSASGLDTMAVSFIDAIKVLWKAASGISDYIYAGITIVAAGLFGGLFMLVAIGYITLSKLAIGILLAIGPLFISAALFPATRRYFENWVGQCMNYVFLVMLFSFAAKIEIQMVSSLIPTDFSLSAVFSFCITCAMFVFISLNLPSLAAALAGGVGISSMVRKMPSLPTFGKDDNIKPDGSKGGEIKGNEKGDK